MRVVLAQNLLPGDIMLLPFGKTATVEEVREGTKFVNLHTEYGKTRIAINEEVMIEEAE